MKKLFLLTTLFMVSALFVYQLTNTLEGIFTTKAKDELYNPLKFDGKGRVTIGEFDEVGYEFTERNDSVIIFVEKTVFIFKKEKNQLKGISDWVEKKKYKTNSKAIATNAMVTLKLVLGGYWIGKS